MTFADSTLRWQRWVLAAMFLGSATIMIPGGLLTEPFMLPKMTFLLVGAAVLVSLWLSRVAWTRRTSVPVGPATIALAVVVLLMAVTTVVSPRPWTSLIGYFSRYTGLVPYLVHVVAFLAALRLTDLPFGRTLMRTGVVGLTVVAGYGIVQAAGLDPVQHGDVSLGRTFSTMGNTNFGGAWAGAAVALALALALDRREERGWRTYAAVVAPVGVLYAMLTGTSQGVVVSAAAVVTVCAVVFSDRDSAARAWVARNKAASLALTAGTAAVLLVLGVLRSSVIKAELDQALVERPQFWAAAIDVWRDHPVLGTGLDTFAHNFLAYRPVEHALANGTATTDAPHSVPLGMLANGGALLFLAWMAFVVLVAVALVRGVRRVHGEQRPLLAGFAGVWVGYQLQALISFDEPPLALLHLLSAAVLLAIAWPPRWRELRLPGKGVSQRLNKRGKPVGSMQVPTSTRVLQGASVVLALAITWLGLYPLRADAVAASAAPLTSSGQLAEASERFDRASRLNPSEARYLYVNAQVYGGTGQGELALEAAEEAARRDPGPVEYVLLAARQAEELGRVDRARELLEDAARRDPRDPPVLNEVALFFLKQGDAARAEGLLERSVDLRADDPESLVLLGQARQAQDDPDGAREAFEQAVAAAPDDELAQQALASLAP